jgi:hypothetical protein
MKRRPECHRIETDDALAFCRADGTVLISDSSSIDQEAGTVKLGSGSVANETPPVPDVVEITFRRGARLFSCFSHPSGVLKCWTTESGGLSTTGYYVAALAGCCS